MDNTVERGGKDREKALRGRGGWGPEHVREEEPLQDERDNEDDRGRAVHWL